MRTVQRTRRLVAGIACAILAGMHAAVATAADDAHRVNTNPAISVATQTNYAIGFYAISTGGNVMSNSCYRFKGTLAQTAPGYSSGNNYALIAGYWQFVPPANPDEIFYNGYEAC